MMWNINFRGAATLAIYTDIVLYQYNNKPTCVYSSGGLQDQWYLSPASPVTNSSPVWGRDNVVCLVLGVQLTWPSTPSIAWPMLWPHSEARVHAVIRVRKVNCNICPLFCDDSDIKQINLPHCHCCKWFWCNFRPKIVYVIDCIAKESLLRS